MLVAQACSGDPRPVAQTEELRELLHRYFMSVRLKHVSGQMKKDDGTFAEMLSAASGVVWKESTIYALRQKTQPVTVEHLGALATLEGSTLTQLLVRLTSMHTEGERQPPTRADEERAAQLNEPVPGYAAPSDAPEPPRSIGRPASRPKR